MKIGLIADTHIEDRKERLKSEVFRTFNGVELILHAGDVYVPTVLDQLEEIAPVLCARGNGDDLLSNDGRVKDAHLMEIEGLSMGLIHGLDYPEPPWRSLEKAMEYEFGRRVDIIVFGDSHVALIETYKGVFLVNPGSLTFPNGLVNVPGTIGILEVEEKEARAEIVQLKW
jgi:putative phosphoesterase